MTGRFADRLFRVAFVAAGAYNLAFGLWAAVWPLAFFQLFAIPAPRYPGIWACLGMVVGLYGILYWYAAWKLDSAWPIIAVGLVGKVLGPIGMAMSWSDDWPRRLGMLCVFNDLIWWLPFGLFLVRGSRLARRLERLAPWMCVASHAAALAMLALVLRHGGLVKPDAAVRGEYVAANSVSWSVGWAIWMFAAATLVGFYAWWGANIAGSVERGAWSESKVFVPLLAVVIAAVGMVCDFAGESLLALVLVEQASGDLVSVFGSVERAFVLLSAGAANGLYTIGGILLTITTPGLPSWVRATMWGTWAAGAAMTVAAIIGSVNGLVVSAAVLFPLLFVWLIWMAIRWRAA